MVVFLDFPPGGAHWKDDATSFGKMSHLFKSSPRTNTRLCLRAFDCVENHGESNFYYPFIIYVCNMPWLLGWRLLLVGWEPEDEGHCS